MARKIKVKLILELRARGESRNAIALHYRMSKRTVCEVFDLADELGLNYEGMKDKGDEEVYRIFFPDRNNTKSIYESPDWDYIHVELAKVGVTLKLLHSEYQHKCQNDNKIAMGYGRFCREYSSYVDIKSVTSHIDHKPAVKLENDWAGQTMKLVDEQTGEIIKVYLYVATLPYSQYSYVEPTLDMKEATWIRCNVHTLEYFGGSPIKIVCDNLKTAVISHPKEGEIALNDAYLRFAEHYLVAIMPAGVKKPKHKPSVEGTVGKITTAIIASLRNTTFHDFSILKAAVAEKLEEFNAKGFQKRAGSRKSIFELREKPLLRELPVTPYEVCTWVYGRKVGLDSHIAYAKNRYSVSHHLIGNTVDVRITDTVVEIYADGERFASHKVFPLYVENAYSTRKEDMPNSLTYHEWDDVRICKWAESIGPETTAVIQRIFTTVKVKEQAYNPCLSVLGLSKKYSQERLEAACDVALTKVTTPRYRHLKQILDTNQDKLITDDCSAIDRENDSQGFIRGGNYYGGGYA